MGLQTHTKTVNTSLEVLDEIKYSKKHDPFGYSFTIGALLTCEFAYKLICSLFLTLQINNARQFITTLFFYSLYLP